MRAHLVRNTHHHLKVRTYTRTIAGLVHLLQIAIVVRYRAGLLIQIRRRQHHIRQHRGLRKEHLLHHHEGTLQCCRIDPITQHGICANHIQRGKLPLRRCVEHLQQVSAGCRRSFVLGKRLCPERRIARQHVRQQAHIRRTARVHVIRQQRQLSPRNRQSKLDQLLQVRPAQLRANQDQQAFRAAQRVAQLAQRFRIVYRPESGRIVARKKTRQRPIAERLQLYKRLRPPPQLDLFRICDVKLRTVQTNVCA